MSESDSGLITVKQTTRPQKVAYTRLPSARLDGLYVQHVISFNKIFVGRLPSMLFPSSISPLIYIAFRLDFAMGSQHPLGFDELIVHQFYWVRLVFPNCLNEDSPLNSRVSASGAPPVFQVEHLHRRNTKGYWGVDRACGLNNCLGPCLIIQSLEESQSVVVMIGSTNPYHAHRWLPLGHEAFLPRQPLSLSEFPAHGLVTCVLHTF
jgi:hypothetical protein